MGRHQVIPLPFNQAKIATTTKSPRWAGRTKCAVPSATGTPFWIRKHVRALSASNDPTEKQLPVRTDASRNYEGGKRRPPGFRTPGLSSESESYTAGRYLRLPRAAGAFLKKRISPRFSRAGVSYTYSHTTDEQSALGAFSTTANDPNNLRSGYGSSDFDRKHVVQS